MVNSLLETDPDNPEAVLRSINPFMEIKCVVCARNSSGSADYLLLRLQMTEDNYNLGGHYGIAMEEAESQGYEMPCVVADENERLFEPFKGMDWTTAKIVDAYREDQGGKAKTARQAHMDMFPREDWEYEVANGDTRLGYDEWLAHRVEGERGI